ncbi:DUF2264 domain-containing protein, partial [Streptomyces himalayensis]|uniref:DUF2264 domain-containing protein n=1 Tax=Streptomyces himalayensis TaxID=2820085 RepID=UPI0035A82741
PERAGRCVRPGQQRPHPGRSRHFTDHGAPDGNGLLSLGWHAAWPVMRQAYSGPGPPYWGPRACSA